MWKLLLMGFIHSTLSSLFFFMSINFDFHFGRIDNLSASWLNKNEIPRNQKVHFCYTTFLCHGTFDHSVHTIPPTDDNCQRQTLLHRILRAWFLSSWIYCEIMKLHCYKKAEAVWAKSGGEIVPESQWENVSDGSIHPLAPCPTSTFAVKISPVTLAGMVSKSQCRLKCAPFPWSLCLEFLYGQTVQLSVEMSSHKHLLMD